MRKLLNLSVVVLVALSATGCNCLRNRCGTVCGGGMFSHQQPAYAAAPAMCCPPPVQCCPQPVQCCDPCAGAGMMGGATVVGSPIVDGGASCCN